MGSEFQFIPQPVTLKSYFYSFKISFIRNFYRNKHFLNLLLIEVFFEFRHITIHCLFNLSTRGFIKKLLSFLSIVC